MVFERFEGGRRSSALIFHKGHEAPEGRGGTLEGAVVVELTRMDKLAFAGERPVGLAVADAHLGGAVEEVKIGHVEINAVLAHPVIKGGDGLELVPLRVVQAFMICVGGRRAHIAWI